MPENIKIKYWWSADKKWFCVWLNDGNACATVSLSPEEASLLSMNAAPPAIEPNKGATYQTHRRMP